jgi:prepilin-type N-terminal cleavage/methylation domain-containing protein
MFWKKPTGIGIGRSIGSICLFFFRKSTNDRTSSEKTTSEISSKNNTGFSLIEIIVSVTVLSGLIIAAFMVFGDIGKIKNRALAGVDIYEQITISSNIFFTTIKQS